MAAMQAIVDALEDFAPDEGRRVLRWACERYGVRL